MASSARQILARLESTTSPPQPAALPGEILREILLRVASHGDLARASAACVAFHQIIADDDFLRRYRSLHPPLLLGFLDGGEFRRAEPPHPSEPVGRVLARAADFDFDSYVPRDGWHGWGTSDVRDGLVLLTYGPWIRRDGSLGVFPDLAVCDPLSHRYRLLPPIPNGLLASIQVNQPNIKSFSASIVPSRVGEADTTFRVMGMTQCPKKFAVFIFSSINGSWSVAASTTWEALGLDAPQNGRVLDYRHNSFAYGCLYRKVFQKNKLLKFNLSTLEFSTVELPPKHDELEIVIVEAGQGRLGVVSQINAQQIRYWIRQNGGPNAWEWKMSNINPLPVDYYFSFIVGALGGYVFILGQSNRNPMEAACFSIEIKTFDIDRVGRMMGFLHNIFPYFGYPPSMSPRRI
ncbi:hypothetical protein QOZ80_7BG0603520 [Eleusine coracana subsp. coracana]|nr:hypothetical protein QOZ80_7BG0603520 [Eleusine coracana subsp. coracana]